MSKREEEIDRFAVAMVLSFIVVMTIVAILS